MRSYFYLLTVLVLFFGITLSSNSVYATSEVWLSGSTWIAETDGSRVYSGGSFFDAVNAACRREGSGTINIWNSGNSGPGGSDIYAIWPESNQTLDFHGNTIHCNGNDLVVAIKADRKSNITVKDVNVTGWPRYGFWFTGCSNVTFTDITMDISSGLGIRYSGRDSYASNLTINGNIDIRSVGHAIETYTVDGVNMGTVTVRSNSGCGVLLNDSENVTIDAIYAYDCSYGGSYAGFRQANSNGKTWVGFLYARRCGRGFYSVSGSNNCTVDRVDIADCSTSGASVSNTSHDVYINSGTITNSNVNVDIWNDAWNVCMRVNGGSYGDACGSGGGGGGASYYQLRNRGTGLYLDGMGRTTNGEACGQYANTSHENAQWEMISNGSYYQLRNRGTGLFLDGMGRTSNGSDVGQWANTTHVNSQWSLQQYSGNYYRLQNRGTGLYLDGMGRTTNGSAAGQWANTTSVNAQWELILVSGSGVLNSRNNEELKVFEVNNELKVYPNPASDVLNISLPSEAENGAKVQLVDAAGKVVLESAYSGAGLELDIASISAGFYILIVDDGVSVVKEKVMIE